MGGERERGRGYGMKERQREKETQPIELWPHVKKAVRAVWRALYV